MKKQHFILLILIIVLSGYLFLSKSGKTNYQLPVLDKIEKQNTDKIQIISNKDKITLSRVENNWVIEPEKFEADNKKIDKILDIICNLKLTDLASQTKNYGKYQLTENKKITVKLSNGDKTIREFEIGKTASSYKHTFVKLKDDANIYYASGNFKSDFEKTKDELRNKTVLSFDEEVLSINLNDNGKKLEIIRKGFDKKTKDKNGKENTNPQTKWVDGSGKQLKTEIIENLISNCRNIQCSSFVEKVEELKKPIYSLSLKGSKDYSLTIYKKTKEGKYIAKSSESKYVFLLESYKAEQLMKKFKDFYPEKK